MMNCRSVRKKFNGVYHLMRNGRLSFALRRTNGNQWEEIDNAIMIYTSSTSVTCSMHGTWNNLHKVFSCDQAALQMVQSVCLSVSMSVRPSVTPLSLCSHHRIVMKFSGVITYDKIDVHATGQGQRSKVKVTEVKTPLDRFRTETPFWIHRWLWNDAERLK